MPSTASHENGEDEEEGIQMLMMWCDIVIYNNIYWVSVLYLAQSSQNPWDFLSDESH